MEDQFRVDFQVHLFFEIGGYDINDVLRTMEKKGLDAIAMLPYSWDKQTSDVIPYNTDTVKREHYVAECWEKNYSLYVNKKTGRKLYIFFGEEVAPVNNQWHFLSIGATGIESSCWSENIIEQVLAKGGLLIFDHPFANPRRMFRNVRDRQKEELLAICNKYKSNIVLEWNSYCIPWIRECMKPFGYGKVNTKTERISSWLDIPLVPTTDLHARNKRLLQAMGTSFIEIPRDDIDFNHLMNSLRANVLKSNFTSQKRYVSFWHFLEAFGVPILAGR